MQKANEAVEVVEKDDLAVIDDTYTVVFSTPYNFEGTEYTKVDLSGLKTMTTEDMVAVNRILERSGVIIVSPQPEATIEFTSAMAARASKLPLEFFLGLPIPEGIKVKNRVAGFFYGAA